MNTIQNITGNLLSMYQVIDRMSDYQKFRQLEKINKIIEASEKRIAEEQKKD